MGAQSKSTPPVDIAREFEIGVVEIVGDGNADRLRCHEGLLVSDGERSGVGLDVSDDGRERGRRAVGARIERLGKAAQLASGGAVALGAEGPRGTFAELGHASSID
jgi:hypothetical protein